MKSKEALEELKDEIIPDYALEYEDDEGYKNWIKELYNIIKQDLDRLEKLEKTIEILKDKGVVIGWLATMSLEAYNKYAPTTNPLTPQEYELLKEVLKDETSV